MVPEAQEPDRLAETQQLARDARAGSLTSFDRLYRRIAPAIYSWASLKIRPRYRSGIDPEDIVQEVWLRACRIFHSYDDARTSFRAWVFSVAKFVMLEQYRRCRRFERAGAESTRQSLIENCPHEVTSLSQKLARDESVRLFLEMVARLPEDERRVLVHCGLEGLTAAETATRIGASQAAVAKRWERLRKRFREQAAFRELLLVD